jgi:integrase
MSQRRKQRSQRGAVSKILRMKAGKEHRVPLSPRALEIIHDLKETSGDKLATKTPTADVLRELGALGLTVEQIVPLVEVVEWDYRRRLARASEKSLDELERVIRNAHALISAGIGDEKESSPYNS